MVEGSHSNTSVIQVTNIAPNASLEQMKTLFSFLGEVEEIVMYPDDENNSSNQSKVCYVKFIDPTCVPVSQHLTNTVFIDRALIIQPHKDDSIPDAETAASLTSGVAFTGGSNTGLISQIVPGVGGVQVISTIDPRLSALGLPQYPPLPANTDPQKVEEIRRTIYVGNLDSKITAEEALAFFNQMGEVKYVRMAGDETQPTRFAFIEFTEQSSVANALQYNGVTFGGRPLKINHSNNAIVKPQPKPILTDPPLLAVPTTVAPKDIEEALKRVKEAQSQITAQIDPAYAAKEASRDRYDSRSHRSRDRSRSRSRRRSTSRDRRRSRSRERVRSRRSRSRDRDRSRRSPHRRRSYSKERKRPSRSRSRSRERHSRRYRRTPTPDRDRRKERDRDRERRRSLDRRSDRDIPRERDRSRERDSRSTKVSSRRRSRSISRTPEPREHRKPKDFSKDDKSSSPKPEFKSRDDTERDPSEHRSDASSSPDNSIKGEGPATPPVTKEESTLVQSPGGGGDVVEYRKRRSRSREREERKRSKSRERSEKAPTSSKRSRRSRSRERSSRISDSKKDKRSSRYDNDDDHP